MRIEPLGDKIVVKRTDPDEMTAGGILLLLANGSRADFQVSEGDRVLFSSYAGSEIEIDGNHLLIMSEAEILAVFE